MRDVATGPVRLCESNIVWRIEVNVLKIAVTVRINHSHKLLDFDPGIVSGSRGGMVPCVLGLIL